MSMKHERVSVGKRRPVNLSIDQDIVRDARALGISLSKTAEAAIQAEVKAERIRRFQEENKDAFAYWNDWVETNGLPLEKYRLF
jgi:antitoxin CcdA